MEDLLSYRVGVTLVSKLVGCSESRKDYANVLPANPYTVRVEPRGFEPLTSAVQRRPDGLPELSGACKMPANCRVFGLTLSLAFREIYSGCCTALTAHNRTRSGTIAIRLTARRRLMRA